MKKWHTFAKHFFLLLIEKSTPKWKQKKKTRKIGQTVETRPSPKNIRWSADVQCVYTRRIEMASY